MIFGLENQKLKVSEASSCGIDALVYPSRALSLQFEAVPIFPKNSE
jgi:hypothetical protein